jgi:hypothetical protein
MGHRHKVEDFREGARFGGRSFFVSVTRGPPPICRLRSESCSAEEGSPGLPDLGGPDRYGGNNYGRGRFCAGYEEAHETGETRGSFESSSLGGTF